MKLSYRQIEPFVQNPDKAVRVILAYGPDQGLMRERAKTMALSVVEDVHDPFNVVTLSTETLNEDPARLSDEANAISMMGGQRLIRIENGGDKLTQLIKEYLQNPNSQSVVIIEAGELGPRSSLRKHCEKDPAAVAIPCYVEDEQDLLRFIRKTLQDHGQIIENDAAQWLAFNISGDRAKVRSELEKISLYKTGEDSSISLDDVQNICGQAGAQSFDTLVYAMASRNPQIALATFQTLLEEGIALIAILRSMQNHFRRLHSTKAKVLEGHNIDQAMKSLAPPIFFKQQNAFKAQVGLWSLPALSAILNRMSDLEAQSKTTGTPAETLCAQTILGISAKRTA